MTRTLEVARLTTKIPNNSAGAMLHMSQQGSTQMNGTKVFS